MAAPIFHKTHLVDSVSLFLKVVAMILMLQTAHDGGIGIRILKQILP